MKYFFQENPRKLLRSFSYSNCLIALDFDGTLAPIVSDPDKAGCSPKVKSHLKELKALYPLAIISGRSLTDLRKRVPDGITLIGNHGLEGLPTKKNSLDRLNALSKEWTEEFQKRRTLNELGITLENKTYSLALHFRNSNQKQKAKSAILEFVAGLRPQPRIILGKSVVNILPAGAPHKGVALLELMKQFEVDTAIYIGDDDTDEDIFSLPDERILSVRVGLKRESFAQFYLKRQNEVSRLLKEIIGLRKRAE